MTNISAEITYLIHHLKTFQREIPIEGEAQQATIARMFVQSVPEIIEKLRRLEVLENEYKTDRPARAYALRIHD